MKPVQYRSLSSARVGLALTLALGLGACADALTGTLEPTAGASKSLAIATPSDAQTLAKGLALAMRDPSIRAQVHAAMRGSSFNEHKLVLQDFANTPRESMYLARSPRRSVRAWARLRAKSRACPRSISTFHSRRTDRGGSPQGMSTLPRRSTKELPRLRHTAVAAKC